MQDMRTDAELLCALLNETPTVHDRVTGGAVVLNTKAVCHWTGRAVQTVSDYRIGKTNIPVDFWKSILAHHFDARIVSLIMPDDVLFEAAFQCNVDHLSALDVFRSALESESKHHETMKYIADILADGRVDELDASTVQAYDDVWLVHRSRDAALHRTIIKRYRQATQKKEAAR